MADPPNAVRASVEVADLEPGELRVVECGRHRALLCNVAGELYAVAERCSHAAFSLAEGRLEGPRIECPLHGALFDVRDGSPLRRPAFRPLETYRVTRNGSRAEIHFEPPRPGGSE